MTTRLRAARAVVAAGDATAAAYRGTLILGYRSPVALIADASVELTAVLCHADFHYLSMLLHRSEVSRVRALEGIELLMQAAPKVLKGRALADARVLLAGRRRVLLEGWDGAERHAKGLLADVGRARAVQEAERLAASMATPRFGAVVAAVEDLVQRTLAEGASAGQGNSLRLFLQALAPTDHLSWSPIYRRLAESQSIVAKAAQVRAAGGVDAYGEEAFRRLFRSNASNLKGLAFEAAFWKSPEWLDIERELVRQALKRGRQLSGTVGGELALHFIREPLRDARTGLELYDGAMLLARPTAANPNVFEGYLFALIQLKAEKRISVIRQVTRDTRRERVLPGDLVLRSSDQSRGYVIRPLPEEYDPLRIIGAPQLPDAPRFSRAATGVDFVFVPALVDADQLDDVAYLLIRAVVDGGTP
jgi:hypothetical protein